MKSLRLTVLVQLLLFLIGTTPSFAANYQIVPAQSGRMNNLGQIAAADGKLWSGGVSVEIGPFMAPGFTAYPNLYAGYVTDIDDAERMAAVKTTVPRSLRSPCGSYNASSQVTIIHHGDYFNCIGGEHGAITNAINGTGILAGYYLDYGGPYFEIIRQPSLFSLGSIQPLPALGSMAEGEALDINDAGQAVGFLVEPSNASAPYRAILWRPGDPALDLGTLGGTSAMARRINNAGDIIGSADTATGESHGFLWRNGVMTDLGSFAPVAINNLGTMVGTDSSGGTARPIVYENNLATDLNTLIPSGSGWEITQVHDINDRGQITCSGRFNGVATSCLLTPDSDPLVTADLSLTVTPAQNPYLGGNMVYNGVITNNGPAAASGVVLAAGWPMYEEGIITVSQGACGTTISPIQYDPPYLLPFPDAFAWCRIGALAPGASVTFQLTNRGPNYEGFWLNLQPRNSTFFVARLFAREYDTEPAGNRHDLVVQNISITDVSLTATVSHDQIEVGESLTYTYQVGNNGPNDIAHSVILNTGVVMGPRGFSLVSINTTHGTCSANPEMKCDIDSLGVNETATVTLVAAPVIAETMTVSASASYGGDSIKNNNNVTLNTNVTGPPSDLALSLVDSPDPVNLGETVTYTATVTNNGPNPASHAVVSGSLLGASAPFPDCVFSNFGVGQSVTCSWTAVANTLGTMRVFARLRASVSDTNTSNNLANATTTVIGGADLSLVMTDRPDPVLQGGTVTYEITVTNNGPNDATNVTVSGSLPSCSFGTLASGASASCARTAVASTVGALTQTMNVSASENDPNLANNSASASTIVIGGADVSVTMTDSPDPVKKGAKLTYNITVTNNGPRDAGSVALTAALPADVVFENAHASQGSCSGTTTVVCSLGNLTSGANANVTIVIKPKSTGTISNTATVTADEADPNGGNNSATESTSVVTDGKKN